MDNNKWMNGYVLNLDQSVSLCVFVNQLYMNHKAISDQFDDKSYNQALLQTLTQFTPEDCQKHGCLLEIKVALAMICDKATLSNEIISLLYAKDFARLRRKTLDNITQNLQQNPPSKKEISDVIEKRDVNAILSVIAHYIKGEKRMITQLNQMTKALMNEPTLQSSSYQDKL